LSDVLLREFVRYRIVWWVLIDVALFLVMVSVRHLVRFSGYGQVIAAIKLEAHACDVVIYQV